MVTTPDPQVTTARRCPACGRDGHPERELCGWCGADLDTGRELPTAPRVGSTGALAVLRSDQFVSALHHLRDRAVVVLVGVVTAATLVVAALLTTGRGPFASPPPLDRVVFDPAAYPSEPAVLEVAGTGSVPASDGTAALVDGDQRTAWLAPDLIERDTGPVRAVLAFDEPVWIAQVIVRNGDQSDPAAYERRGRVRRLVLVVDGDRRIGVDLLDVGIEDQIIELASPELTTRVEIEVELAFAGTDERRAALSGIELIGWIASSSDRDLALVRSGQRTGEPTIGPLGLVVVQAS